MCKIRVYQREGEKRKLDSGGTENVKKSKQQSKPKPEQQPESEQKSEPEQEQQSE